MTPEQLEIVKEVSIAKSNRIEKRLDELIDEWRNRKAPLRVKQQVMLALLTLKAKADDLEEPYERTGKIYLEEGDRGEYWIFSSARERNLRFDSPADRVYRQLQKWSRSRREQLHSKFVSVIIREHLTERSFKTKRGEILFNLKKRKEKRYA